MKPLVYILGALLSLGLIAGSLLGRLPLDVTEVLGFVTGGWSVWLTVEQNIWNWPIGIANSAFFLILFVRARLFADSSLQVVYIVLGILGWYWWLHGGEYRSVLPVSRTGPRTALAFGAIATLATAALTIALRQVHDAAPFWDALTTVMSLVAQYMLTRKLYENWFVWLTADVIYVGLYAIKGLPLTAALYAIFIAMCVAGVRQWRVDLGAQALTATARTEADTPQPAASAAINASPLSR